MTDVHIATRPRSFYHAFVLALPPTVTVLAMTAIVQLGANTRLVFAPLAASAFLIYRSPHERSNYVGVVVTSQIVGLAAGLAAASFRHPGYFTEALALLATISVLIALDMLHAPAVPTALIFADMPLSLNHVFLFVADVAVLALLCVAQRALHRTLFRGAIAHRATRHRR